MNPLLAARSHTWAKKDRFTLTCVDSPTTWLFVTGVDVVIIVVTVIIFVVAAVVAW